MSRGKPTAIDIHVGKRLREARVVASLSEEKLASKLGVTTRKLGRYEQGVERIGADFLIRSAMVLNVGVAYFYEGLQSPTDGDGDASRAEAIASIMKFVATEEGIQLNLAFAEIGDPKLRKQAIEIIRHLSAQSHTPH